MICAPTAREAVAIASPSVETQTLAIRFAACAALIGYCTIGRSSSGSTFLLIMDLDPARAVTMATFMGAALYNVVSAPRTTNVRRHKSPGISPAYDIS